MSIIVFKKRSASGFFRWNELRPMIEPNPPPSRIARTCSNTASSRSAAPPEKITIRRPANAPRARVEGEADRHAAQAHGVADAAGERLRGIALLEQHVVAVELEDQRELPREIARPGPEEAERRRVPVAAPRARPTDR